MTKGKSKSVKDAEEALRKAQEKAATDTTANSDAVAKAERDLAEAKAGDPQAGPSNTWPPEGLEFKTPKDTESK